MKNQRNLFLGLFSVLCIAGFAPCLHADDTMATILPQFKSADPNVRSAAFAKAASRPAIEKKAAYEKALIGLLNEEIYYSTSTPITELQDNDKWNAYYINLIGAVAKLRNSDSIPTLIQVMDKGDVVTQTLAGFGPLVLDPILEKLNDGSEAKRLAAVTVLFEMLNPENETKLNDQKIRNRMEVALKKAIHDKNPNIHNTATEALNKLKTLKKPPESIYIPSGS